MNLETKHILSEADLKALDPIKLQLEASIEEANRFLEQAIAKLISATN